MKTTFINNILSTTTPYGLKLETKRGRYFGVFSKVYNGNVEIFYKPSELPNSDDLYLKQHHIAAINEFLELAKGKDLTKPLQRKDTI